MLSIRIGRFPAVCYFTIFVLWPNPDLLATQNPYDISTFASAKQDAANTWESSLSLPASPSLSIFGNQLLSNFKGLFSTQNIKPFVIGSAATVGSIPFDDDMRDYFGEERRAEPLGEIGNILGHPVVLGAAAGGILLWSYNTSNNRFRSMSFSLSQALIVNYATVSVLTRNSHQ